MFVTPAGSESLMKTFVAGDGPALWTAIVQVMVPPAATGFGVAVFTSVTRDAGSTVVVTVQAVGSTLTPGSAEPTQTFVIGPVVVGALPVIVTVLSPTGSVVAVQLTACPPTAHVCVGQLATMLVTPAGSESLTTTLVAGDGPAL
jgi:hypothetical protein